MKTILVIAPQLVAIFVSTVLISIVAIYYQRSLKKIKSGGVPRGLLLIIERMVVAAENFVVEMLGARYKCLTIYFLYLILYLSINNLLDLFGIESATTSFTVVLSLGVVCFIGIYYFGIKFHKLHFFKKYLINPPEIFGQFVPLISISFRLFGNLLGGSLLIALVMQFTHFL